MKDLKNPEYYLNREWSWMEFNFRVVNEAGEKRNPLLERLKFIAIVSSNLEEFFMVRVSILKKQVAFGSKGRSIDKKLPAEQLEGIQKRYKKLKKIQQSILYDEIIPELKKNGVEILMKIKDLKPYENYLDAFFETQIKQVITPLSVGPTHPFPNLVSGKLYLAVELEPNEDSHPSIEKSNLSFIELPVNTYGRFIKIKDEEIYVPIELVIKKFVGRIYNGYNVLSAGIIRLTRDADFSINPDAISDLLVEIESNIKRMHKREAVKLEHEKGISENILNPLIKESGLTSDYIYPYDGLINLKDLFSIYFVCGKNELKEKVVDHIYPVELKGRDLFEKISREDLILYHPYHSYDPVVDLLKQAADDDKVLAIKQTLYRTSSRSQIIDSLIRAAENGKYVTVVDELQARFDEKRNIESARQLEEAGAHVIYGIAGLKTHAKALLIIRKEKKGIKRYLHMATGNYNEMTSKLYTDFSFFTSEEYIGEDVSTMFNLLTGFSLPNGWNHISVAPLNLREKFISLIRRERDNAKNGIKGKIIAKMNSLLDEKLVKELYEASCAGVKIDLIVRGICALRPGITGVSENIRVISIIGTYLEHPRVYYFHNGGEEEYFMSSADWMTRNLDRRVELLFPVRGKKEREFLNHILELQFEDNVNAWLLNSDGSYNMLSGKEEKDSFVEIYKFICQNNESNKKSKDELRPLKKP